MTFNTGAIPVAVALIAIGCGNWIFRLRLTKASDRFHGVKRSETSQIK